MTPDQATERQAAAVNCQAELLRELQHAHRIIQNGLQIMSVLQKSVCMNARALLVATLLYFVLPPLVLVVMLLVKSCGVAA